MRIARAFTVVPLLLALCLVASGCSGGPNRAIGLRPSPSAPSASSASSRTLPAPDAPIPTDAGQLAATFVDVTKALQASIDRWRRTGGVFGRPPAEIVLRALYQQRICRTLAGDSKLASATLALLPPDFRPVPQSVVAASALFQGLVRPVTNPAAFRTGPPEPAGVLLRHYREGERRFGIDWEVLAALNYIESKFGRVKSTSYAGAQGPMQFIPSTWEAYGMGGDVQDPHDAILGAANYLHHFGAPRSYRKALFAYNHSRPYVDAVLLYARLIQRDIRNYFAMYNWQVYVLTTDGAKRLTGPGI